MIKTIRLCSVDECDGSHYAKGYCRNHYNRFKRYNDPLGGTPQGEPLAWLYENITICTPDECLLWPYGASHSYGMVKFQGKVRNAHRVSLIIQTGLDPQYLDAAHGPCHSPSCVNPHHLSWKTRSENLIDRVRDGTHHRGERSRVAKLTESQVLAIRADERRHKLIAANYGISTPYVSGIKHRKNWDWLS